MCVWWGWEQGGLHFRNSDKQCLLEVLEHPRRWVLLSHFTEGKVRTAEHAQMAGVALSSSPESELNPQA